MTARHLCLVPALILSLAAPAFAQTPEERAAARDLATKRGPAVVMVLATLKARRVVNGRESAGDVPVQTNGTVLDATGLTVLPLSAIEPGPSAFGRGGGEVSTELTELRMHLGDGRELSARVVLRDPDLDLVLIRPTDDVPAPLTAIDATNGTVNLADLGIVIQRASESSGWRTFVGFTYVQMVVERPRPYYLLALGSLNGLGLGNPVFDATGKFLGIISQVGGTRATPRPALVPATDVRDLAKQAAK